MRLIQLPKNKSIINIEEISFVEKGNLPAGFYDSWYYKDAVYIIRLILSNKESFQEKSIFYRDQSLQIEDFNFLSNSLISL